MSWQLESSRETRREIEASVLPLATSVDGRLFSFQASPHGLELQAGGYAVLDDGATRRLGQALSVDLHQQLAGELTLPASAAGGPDGDAGPLCAGRGNYRGRRHRAVPRRADPPAAGSDVRAWQQRETGPHAQLALGELALATGVPCVADAAGFSRHTFLCGQSGSGKTYSLGVILERLLIETDLRLVIFDPNSDFTRLAQVRADADPALAERYRQAARRVAVYSAGASGEQRLRLHAAEVEPVTQAAALRLDPIADREEYAALAALLASPDPPTMEALTGATFRKRRDSVCA